MDQDGSVAVAHLPHPLGRAALDDHHVKHRRGHIALSDKIPLISIKKDRFATGALGGAIIPGM
jgi:hypothetical protein